ncbi:DUF3558 domain-containing protein [Nocardia sp. CA2R105]|uniref:DUF3558 family protein n=1 Tax=Nocardia coffeae TaxID=2873381 RepID=UPI001CA78E2B|nr:DUF3558 family protein [Nocardia coffeae]MBY8855895.1 DUF3558 domain-containing protein [Nocardia coffeae]
MKVSVWACIGAAALTTVVACSSNGGDSSNDSASPTSSVAATASVRPTLMASNIQPPSQKDNQYSEGLPEVVFDPCTWIGDQTIQKAGFDPASRHRLQDMVAEQTFLTCAFKSEMKTLTINSSNVPWDQDLQKHASHTRATTVNGRQAIWVDDKTFAGACEIDLRTKAGFVQIFTDPTDKSNVNPSSSCDGMLNIATLIEPEIGKGN